ncbi:unnamed protein product, partial [Discosporangium mesarthrocarpum]
ETGVGAGACAGAGAGAGKGTDWHTALSWKGHGTRVADVWYLGSRGATKAMAGEAKGGEGSGADVPGSRMMAAGLTSRFGHASRDHGTDFGDESGPGTRLRPEDREEQMIVSAGADGTLSWW